MPHGLSHVNGTYAMVSGNNKIPWHQLGTVKPGLMTATELLTAGHMANWNARKIAVAAGLPVANTDGVGTRLVTVPDLYTTVFDNPLTGQTEIIGGALGAQYTHVQNEELAALGEALTDEAGGAFFETGGALNNFASVFMTARLPEGMLVGGVDRIDLYLSLLNTHNGTGSLTAMVSPVRIVCANTQRAALAQAEQMWTIRHTSGALRAVAEAKRSLGLTRNYADALQAELDRMIDTELSEARFEEIVAGLFEDEPGEGEHPRTRNARVERMDIMRGLWHDADTQANCRGTNYGAWQVVQEWADHHRPARGETEEAAAAARAWAAVARRGEGSVIKAAAFEAFRVPVNA